MSGARRVVQFNPSAESWTAPASPNTDAVLNFHQSLPNYQPTKLVSLGEVAKELGVKSVFVKDETERLGLPSFKILGASWGTFCALLRALHLSEAATFEQVKKALEGTKFKLYAATDGNHGRAVARMGSLLAIPAEIHVPRQMSLQTIELIESEGAHVISTSGSYEDAIAAANAGANADERGILVQDTAFEGYEEIPGWIVEGYGTMLREIDEQLGNKNVDLVVCPVGVGSLALSVLTHFKREGRQTAMVTVEPDTAACLWTSVHKGEWTAIETTPTIMAGLDCGQVSTTAWPFLRDGVDACLTVSDYEAHMALGDLKAAGVHAGPCGSSPLAALRRLRGEDGADLGLTGESTVVLICTEGTRDYMIPTEDGALCNVSYN
ncbi:tryptophan synthase beta subunit-like PLP-dependent enzyme [Emericellopsis atlantica]|uniref:Tryptophan synthase beta subunit-like PLP-dependent enzyme n=1 Tax=Emericellopsis atlantica TaxID=2614577 RepID=A0A9P8CXV6_9HYPO|nr:tryptophan synthase beta subunit-like PLP-dependent enzyme [Emericellopsis atlantica]KAG9259111.1 tryptophan synthase beta subunit-like PLP-dependent enzyme [Emericellopsis atlantica]